MSQGRLRWYGLLLLAALATLQPAAFAMESEARASECPFFEAEGAERLADDAPVLGLLYDAIATVDVAAVSCIAPLLEVSASGHPARDAFDPRAPPA